MVHLHVHTKYSILDATPKIDDAISYAKELGQSALAITDHGNMYGSVEFYKTAIEAGIKPIIGCEVYIVEDVTIMKRENTMYHLILLAKDEIGRQNLQRLVSESTKYKFNKRPRIDFQMLEKYHEGLVCLSACMAGQVSRALQDGMNDKAEEIAMRYKSLFGEDYYIEYQAHEDPKQQELNLELIRLAEKLDIEYVVTADVHYLNQEEQKYHSIYVQIGQDRDAGEVYNDCYLQSEEEVLKKCASTTKYNKKAIETSHKIAEKCNVEYPLSAPIIPHAEVPAPFKSEEEYLKHLCNTGMKKKGFFDWTLEEWKDYMSQTIHNADGSVTIKEFVKFDSTKEILQMYKDRAKYEINSVVKMGFEGYYLLVHSYISSAKRRGIARGSAGGSLLAFLCGIVDIDPIKYGLYFERFIDVGALDLLDSGAITKKQLKIPDVDADFSPKDRDKVMQFIIDKYHEENVVCLGTFGYLWAKSAIKDIGKVLNIPFEVTNTMTKKLGNETIDEALEYGLLDEYKDKYPELFDYAGHLSGLIKSHGCHACFTEDNLVMTNEGFKKIKDIRVGDSVLTHTGNYKLVAKTTENKTNKLSIIKGVGFFETKSTLNHPYFVKHRINSGSGRIYSEPEWVDAKDVVKSDMVCLPINTFNTIPEYENLPTNNKDFWWIIGRYIGDGWCEYYEQPRNEKRVIICCGKVNNKDLIDISEKLDGLFDYRTEEGRTTHKIHIKNESLFKFLQRFGKYANKKHLTKDIFNLPVDLLESFLNGYTSADGYLDKHGTMCLKTVSYELANGIIQCVAKVYHINCYVHKINAKKECIEGRLVNSKDKYIVEFKKLHKEKDLCKYDPDNNCVWLYVRSNNIVECENDISVYNMSVVDDNSYTVNNIAVHNCGKVISMRNADYYNALEYDADKKVWILQGDMHTADDLGLVKIDLLGLRTLDVIYDVLDMIGKNYDYIAPHKINLCDKNVWNEFSNGNSLLIFQFESPGMRRMLKDMNCNSIDNLSAANALYRPGAKQYISNYIARRNGEEPIVYINDMLKPILENTYGIIVYQEQLIEIGRLAGLKNPDELRQATAKKKPKLMAKIEPELKNGLINLGWTQEQVDTLWNDILVFAKYSFNKCVAGDTVIYKPATRKTVRTPSVEEMYKIRNDVNFAKENNYLPLRNKYIRNGNYGTALSMYEDGKIRKNIIEDIQEAGLRDVYRITTKSGRMIECTDNHKFPTECGNKRTDELSVGDNLYAMGRTKAYENGIDTVLDEIVSIEHIGQKMTYDVTMADPAHNFVIDNGLVTCNSHSAAYALTAYITMYLKTHHPVEFITATINSYDGDSNKIAEVISEAKRMGVVCKFDNWRKIKPETTCRDGICWLGINTIKGFGKNVANGLQRLSYAQNYIELLQFCKEDDDIDESHIEKLTYLDMFSEFGSIQELLVQAKLYKNVYNRKQYDKKSLPEYVPEYILQKYAKETEKQYREIRGKELFEDLCKQYNYPKTNVFDKIRYQDEYLGYIIITVPKLEDSYYYIREIDENWITLYQIKTGALRKVKCRAKTRNANPIDEKMIINVKEIAEEKKYKKDENGNWIRIDELEDILKNYSVLT